VLPARAATPRDIGLAAEVTPSGTGFALAVRAERFARFVTIDDEQFIADDQGFCLLPGESRIVPLSSPSSEARPAGVVAALNSSPFQYRAIAS
jgi:hypothetical protein